MKKILIILILILVIFLGCTKTESKNQEIRGIFISYIEENRYFNNDINKTKDNIKRMIRNVYDNKFNLIILQVRSNADAIYESNIFPYSSILTGIEGDKYFDVLAFFLEECHKYNIKLYAWINPYRVRTSEDISSISESSPAYKYINTDYIYVDNGIYFNPSKKEVEDLIVDGIEEILRNYKVDGILFDDYFYPCDDIDINDYNEYLKNNSYIDIKQYHLNIINRMVKRVYDTCSNYNVKFGISPDGNISNNYNSLYADIYKWLSEEGYVNFIMPQIYYGFFNENKPFYDTVKEWNNIIENNKVDLIVALALYKSGSIDKFAKSGSDEWLNNSDIIKREVIISRNLSHYSGFALFRYDYIFTEEILNDYLKEEVNNLQEMLN